MLAALKLEQLIIKIRNKEPITLDDLQALYKSTYTEAYKNAQEDQRAQCQCGEFQDDE